MRTLISVWRKLTFGFEVNLYRFNYNKDCAFYIHILFFPLVLKIQSPLLSVRSALFS